jgi:hypothetical protein
MWHSVMMVASHTIQVCMWVHISQCTVNLLRTFHVSSSSFSVTM